MSSRPRKKLSPFSQLNFTLLIFPVGDNFFIGAFKKLKLSGKYWLSCEIDDRSVSLMSKVMAFNWSDESKLALRLSDSKLSPSTIKDKLLRLICARLLL